MVEEGEPVHPHPRLLTEPRPSFQRTNPGRAASRARTDLNDVEKLIGVIIK
jgi:hypothetical protein